MTTPPLIRSVSNEAIHMYMRCLNAKQSSPLRAEAAYCLGQTLSDFAIEVSKDLLQKVLTDDTEDEVVRSNAAEALGMFSEPSSVPALISVLNAESAMIRFWAAYALGQIGDKRAVPALKRLVDDTAVIPDFWSVGAEARDALNRLM